MAKLPSRKELADKIDQLERDLAIFAAGGGTGAFLARSPAARAAAIGGGVRLTPAALAADLLIRQEDALLARGAQAAAPLLEQAVLDPIRGSVSEVAAMTSPRQVERRARAKPKKKSSFNKAVSSGMTALKASTSYGKKGIISNAKAAFKTATKQASAAFRGKKAPTKGPSKVAYRAAKKVYKDEILRRKMK
jgi:hypothetical protein